MRTTCQATDYAGTTFREQAIEPAFGNPAGLAGFGLQTRPIKHRNVSAAVIRQLGLAPTAGGFRHALAVRHYIEQSRDRVSGKIYFTQLASGFVLKPVQDRKSPL